VLSLIFKKGDRELLKNWRPISLLNCDYKIAAFGLANRLHKVLPKIINVDQTGYVKNRFIGCNVRLIEDVIDYVNNENGTGALIFCDFEKAFDTLEINFLLKTLTKFGFGTSFTNWIKNMYSSIQAQVKNNNWVSECFSQSRGIRQGCPLSALLFIIATEIMATVIRKCNKVKGICLPGKKKTEVKISQLADDTTLFVRDEKSAILALKVVRQFGIHAGTRLNEEKTAGIWLGKHKGSEHKMSGSNVVFTSKPLKILGIYVGHDKAQACISIKQYNMSS
jgi:hypothetical protein